MRRVLIGTSMLFALAIGAQSVAASPAVRHAARHTRHHVAATTNKSPNANRDNRAVGRQTASRSTARMHALDTNHDGRIERSEWRGSQQSFDTHDTNHDGVLSGDELKSIQPVKVRTHHRGVTTHRPLRAHTHK